VEIEKLKKLVQEQNDERNNIDNERSIELSNLKLELSLYKSKVLDLETQMLAEQKKKEENLQNG